MFNDCTVASMRAGGRGIARVVCVSAGCSRACVKGREPSVGSARARLEQTQNCKTCTLGKWGGMVGTTVVAWVEGKYAAEPSNMRKVLAKKYCRLKETTLANWGSQPAAHPALSPHHVSIGKRSSPISLHNLWSRADVDADKWTTHGH